jgi:hypothetical protein
MIRRKVLGEITNNEEKYLNQKNEFKSNNQKTSKYNQDLYEVILEEKEIEKKKNESKTPMEVEVESASDNDGFEDEEENEEKEKEEKQIIDFLRSDEECEVYEYVKEIYNHMKENEIKYSIDYKYLSNHKVLNLNIRSIIIEWIIDVHRSFKLKQETLYLTVYIIDKFFSLAEVSKSKFQLVAITSFFIASKYEEIYGPSIEDCTKVTANTYSEKNIIQMESIILETLKFSITVPSIEFFLQRFVQVTNSEKKIIVLSQLITDLCLFDTNYLRFKPSLLAISALFLSRKLFKIDNCFSDEMIYYSGYKIDDLKETSYWIVNNLKKFDKFLVNSAEGINYESIKKKYSTNINFNIVSILSQLMKFLQ